MWSIQGTLRPLRCQPTELVRGMAETSQPTHDGLGVGTVALDQTKCYSI